METGRNDPGDTYEEIKDGKKIIHSDAGVPAHGSVEEAQFYGIDTEDPESLRAWYEETGEIPIIDIEGEQ